MPEEKDNRAISVKTRDEAKFKSLKITLIYLIIGSLWIVFSDTFGSKVLIKADYVLMFSMVKGVFYVLATSALIFGLIYPYIKKVLDSKAVLEEKNAQLTKANELQRSLHMELAKEKLMLRLMIDSIPDIIFCKDLNGAYIVCNKACEKNAGILSEDIIGKTDFDIFPKEKAELYRESDNQAVNSKKPVRVEETITFNHDETAIFDKLKTPLYDPENNIIGSIGIARDITERRKKEEEIFYLNSRDLLTGLYNRSYFLERRIDLDAPENLPLSYIIGDINGMRLINDAFGYQEGDRILKEVAGILTQAAREGDIISRIGGDEFSILLPKTDSHTAKQIADKIRIACERHQKEEKMVCCSMAIGFATKTSAEESMRNVMIEANDNMLRRKLLEESSMRSSILSSVKSTMFEKSYETEEHAERLGELSRMLGVLVGLSEEKLDELVLLAALHDIGKISIDQKILAKTSKLSDEEFMIIRRHPEVGFRIASSTPELKHIAEYILCHHERWDGKGYPQGLAGEEIPLLSRIIGIVDAYDAMTNDRAYRKAMTKESAVKEILVNAETQFDPYLAKLFVDKVISQGN